MNRMLSLTALCHPSGLGEEEREHLFCENLLIIGNLFLSDFYSLQEILPHVEIYLPIASVLHLVLGLISFRVCHSPEALSLLTIECVFYNWSHFHLLYNFKNRNTKL